MAETGPVVDAGATVETAAAAANVVAGMIAIIDIHSHAASKALHPPAHRRHPVLPLFLLSRRTIPATLPHPHAAGVHRTRMPRAFSMVAGRPSGRAGQW